jgi:hypothetical protein
VWAHASSAAGVSAQCGDSESSLRPASWVRNFRIRLGCGRDGAAVPLLVESLFIGSLFFSLNSGTRGPTAKRMPHQLR